MINPKTFKRNIYDKLVNYNPNKNVYRFARYSTTLTYEHHYNFLLFNQKETHILHNSIKNIRTIQSYSIILSAEYVQ